MNTPHAARKNTGWERGQAILRHRVERDFTVLPNSVIRDKRLGFKAFGVLVYLLHLPPDFRVSVSWLSQQRSTGRYAIRAAIDELQTLGYMGVELTRDGRGKFVGWVWWVTDSARPAQRDVRPVSGFPISDNQTSGNRNLISTNEQQELSKTTTTAADAASLVLPPGLPEAERVVVGRLIEGLEPALGQSLLDELAGLMNANKIKSSRIALLRELVARARSGAYIPALAPAVASRRVQEAEMARERLAARNKVSNCDPELTKAKLAEITEQLRGTARPPA